MIFRGCLKIIKLDLVMIVTKELYEKRMAVFHKICHTEKLRVTPQRLEVFSELARSGDHPSAETLYQRIAKRLPTITLDTVYRSLGKLEEVGLVLRVSVVASAMRYEVNTEHHHHFVCRKCGAILDLHSAELDAVQAVADLPEAYQADWAQVELRGLCASCG